MNAEVQQKEWQRAIILVDMNAFFASVEQLDHPEWRGRALVVTNGKQGTCVITSSYEARAFGIKTGMRLYQAKKLCHDVIQVPANPQRYVEVSQKIMQALATLTPDIEIFSIDEAFLDVTKCQMLYGSPEKMALKAKQLVYDASGLLCSVGVSGDKTTAKFAAKYEKPDGLTVIPPWEAKARLKSVPVTELCGIKTGIGRFLERHGVVKCGDMEKVPISILAKRFGNVGRRIWFMCQGADPDPVHTQAVNPKSMGHGKVMPPKTTSAAVVETYLMHMCEKLGSRLRRHGFRAKHFYIGLRSDDYDWIGAVDQTVQATQDGREIFQLGMFVLGKVWHGEPVSQIQVTALDPGSGGLQLDFFATADERRQHVNQVIDAVNEQFGELTLAPAVLLLRSSMPNVIAPAWKPTGHRQHI